MKFDCVCRYATTVSAQLVPIDYEMQQRAGAC